MKNAMTVLILCALPLACGGASVGSACTAIFSYGLTITVTSAATGAPICDAAVTITDGDYLETATQFPASCSYQGAGERAGNYTVDVKSGGSEKKVAGIVVTKDSCHVIGQTVKIAL